MWARERKRSPSKPTIVSVACTGSLKNDNKEAPIKQQQQQQHHRYCVYISGDCCWRNTHSMRKWAIQHIWYCMGDLKQLLFLVLLLLLLLLLCAAFFSLFAWIFVATLFFFISFFLSVVTPLLLCFNANCFPETESLLFRFARTPNHTPPNNSIVKLSLFLRSSNHWFDFFFSLKSRELHTKMQTTIAIFTYTRNIPSTIDCTNQTIGA